MSPHKLWLTCTLTNSKNSELSFRLVYILDSASDNIDATTDTSVDEDIHNLAENINSTLNAADDTSSPVSFNNSQNQLNSQEISKVINTGVKFTLTKGIDDVERDRNLEELYLVKNILDEKISPVIEEIKNKKQTKRSSRRLSVKDAVLALNSSNVLGLVEEAEAVSEELVENPVPGPSFDNTSDVKNNCDRNSVTEEESDVAPNKDKRKPKGRKSISGKGRQSAASSKESCSLDKEIYPAVPQTEVPKQKKTMKKKLMSLTDLTDRHSVLIEPTKCSDDTGGLLESSIKKKRGRKKASVSTGENESKSPVSRVGEHEGTSFNKHHDSDESHDRSNDVVFDESNNINVSVSTEGENVKGLMKNKKKVDSGRDKKSGSGRKRKAASDAHGPRKGKKGKALVNETIAEGEKTIPNQNVHPSGVTQIQDITTQLNLTRDNSITCSIRETTLSMSMSRAYNDVSSILQSSRRSVDEFNLTQKNGKRRRGTKRPALTTVNENVPKSSTSESDTSVNGRKQARLNNSGHRKMIRPSIVMTSLHSQ